jgi:hypothetical protein
VCRTCLFVDLNGGLVGIESNDFTDEHVLADFDLRRSISTGSSSASIYS